MDGVQGIEPAACLIHALRDEVGRGAEIPAAEVPQALLGIRHGTRIEPNVNQVGFAGHLLPAGRNQVNLIHKRTVKVYPVVVFEGRVGRIEPIVFQRIGRHDTGIHRLVDCGIQFRGRSDADLFAAVFGAPDRERRTPETAAAQVPVLDVFQPLSETAGSGGFRLPGYGLVQGHHLVLDRRRLDEPGVQRIIQDRHIRAPAVRIAVNVLLHLEQTAVGLHHQAQVHVQRSFFLFPFEIFQKAALDITAGEFLV